MPDTHDLDAVVVGAGFCGSATAAALRRYGVERVLLLEAGTRFGEFWSGNYDRIKLHSPWHGLPDDGGANDDYPMYKSRAQLLHYFERYAERHSLREVTRFREELAAARRDPGERERPWRIETRTGTDGRTYRSRYLVVCTGLTRQPYVPDLPHRERFRGTVLHSRAFRNGAPFAGQRVLVVGSGNSAFEQATDLVEHGAAPTLLVHGPRHVIPLDRMAELQIEGRARGLAGHEAVRAAHPVTPGTAAYAEGLSEIDSQWWPLAEDLSAFGIEPPAAGPLYELLIRQRVPVFDQGAIPLLRTGEIEILRGRLERFTERGVRLREHGDGEFDAVLLATGFRPGLDGFFPEELTALGKDHGMRFPATDGRCRSTVHPDLFFVGYDLALFGGLNHGHWGFEVGEKIATELGSFREAMRPPEYDRAPWLAA